MTVASLEGLRLLVVEDEAMVAMLVEDMLGELGCVVVEVAPSVKKAVAIASASEIPIDGAVLDVNVGGEKVFPVADALAARGIPFVFATGYGHSALEGPYAGHELIAKPFRLNGLRQALSNWLK